ncbi:transcriptional regulator of acetoin/glycerol metabolism [Aequitasia blattaphilus]|uniref:Sigma 54-interacting transcriptional regulator n=1 Tax=Aequitasia blattaphilus TaxID=2949332 RepID=A0ABT1EAV6_9FIRM|nr:sigma 54-interacting transcriptional regulator [Aequitasia blattaphilus]MCP1102942.1 sigma 54-interacting transcriptional regulator [Aequitasia blattaphilus]MCR8615582.1 sigma 54-interacting transcriptional regulator [Aequitasia blattaphilus]
MISEEYLTHLKQAREIFFEKNELPTELVEKPILDSWVRSRSFHLIPDYVQPEVLSAEQLQGRIQNNQTLYDIATSFMEYLYQSVAGSGFAIIFADKDGYILKMIGDEDVIEIATTKDIPLIEGTSRSESIIGTNSIGTPLYTKEPIQLFAHEHFIELSSNWTCSGAPILGSNGDVLGVICISGAWNKVHAHTLGMATAASEAISRQYSLALANDSLTTMRDHLQTSLDSLHTGTFLLDELDRITFVNNTTVNTLHFSTEELVGQHYTRFFPYLDLSTFEKSTYDIETTLQSKHENIKCYVSIKFISHSRYNHSKETVLISFRRAEYIQQLVNKVIGSDARYVFDNIIGSSPQIQQAKKLAKLVAKSSTNVLITGESGTGKELFAQSIHNHSPFSKGPFIALNCGALPKELIESELFGYDPGSFTGAKKDGRAGKFELANNGTIFLDEIGDMPYEVQVKLLRVLQEKTVTRIGGKKTLPLNVRIITATNVDLEAAIQNHTFRSDLYYRLNVFSLHIPPLSKRGSDVFDLVDYFLEKYQNPDYDPIVHIDEDVKDLFLHYPWPGNIRELENVIERVCILATNGRLSLNTLPMNMIQYHNSNAIAQSPEENPPSLEVVSDQSAAAPSVMTAEKQLILEHLTCSSGNIKKAAESLEISRRTLYRKLEKYQIDLDKLRFSGRS